MSKKKSMSFLLGFFIIAICLLVSQQLFPQAQQTAVPVEQEPRHRIVFQNKNVRIYDCLIPLEPGREPGRWFKDNLLRVRSREPKVHSLTGKV